MKQVMIKALGTATLGVTMVVSGATAAAALPLTTDVLGSLPVQKADAQATTESNTPPAAAPASPVEGLVGSLTTSALGL